MNTFGINYKIQSTLRWSVVYLFFKFYENPPVRFGEILLTNRQTDRQANKRQWEQHPAYTSQYWACFQQNLYTWITMFVFLAVTTSSLRLHSDMNSIGAALLAAVSAYGWCFAHHYCQCQPNN